MGKIILVDDDKFMLRYVGDHLVKWGHEVISLADGTLLTPAYVRAEAPGAILLDIFLPGRTGLEILKELHPAFPEIPIVLITAFGSIEAAVEAIKIGAHDFVTKPIDMQRLQIVVNNALKTSELAQRLNEYDAVRAPRCRCSDIIGSSDAMGKVFETMDIVAESDAGLLITGETGTGKELVAAAIHKRSGRKGKMFVPVNCGALPEGIIESELFGHVKGAFTGAVKDKKGRFELADGGTIFLDEVGDLPPMTQVKLLRVLQQGTFERVGGESSVKVDVRVISATNRDLKVMMSRGEFREDLYYRLCVVPIHIPPLRERRTDIPHLACCFVEKFTADTGRDAPQFSQDCMDMLMDFAWPGNVRQLQNAIQFALLKCKSGMIEPHHLPPEILDVVDTADIHEVQPAHELNTVTAAKPQAAYSESRPGRKPVLDRVAVLAALKQAGDNRAKAARLLGVGRATLYRFLSDHGIE